MSFWNPARMSEDRQLELDTRVILGIAEDKLKKDLERVEKKIKKHRESFIGKDVFAMTRKQRANMNVRADNFILICKLSKAPNIYYAKCFTIKGY